MTRRGRSDATPRTPRLSAALVEIVDVGPAAAAVPDELVAFVKALARDLARADAERIEPADAAEVR